MRLQIGGMDLFGLLLSSCIFTVLVHVRCAFSADATLATSRQRNSQGGNGKQASGLVPLNLRGSNDNIEGSGDMPRGASGKVDPINPDDEDDADVDEDVLSPFEGSGMMPTRPSSPLKPSAPRPSYPIPGGDRSAPSSSFGDEFDINETPDPNAPKIVTTTEMPQPTGNSLDNDRDLTADEDVAREIQDNFGNDPIVQKPANAPANLLAQPAMLAAVIGGAVVGLLCAILLVMYLLYRMRKKDEGSYALDEPQKRPGGYMRAPTNSSKEYYA
ncbi:hypothetical protein RvY_15799-2 [Ramazzottius varieornatus]|uniref:Syndecan n=1 Tax=Ramazzottius varieornatus TaxID=947166 RepID=A0A1D1W410_RAMVA|nr:hypothetical protein RvY_15799-2 [Ramazzottius varieornatus]